MKQLIPIQLFCALFLSFFSTNVWSWTDSDQYTFEQKKQSHHINDRGLTDWRKDNYNTAGLSDTLEYYYVGGSFGSGGKRNDSLHDMSNFSINQYAPQNLSSSMQQRLHHMLRGDIVQKEFSIQDWAMYVMYRQIDYRDLQNTMEYMAHNEYRNFLYYATDGLQDSRLRDQAHEFWSAATSDQYREMCRNSSPNFYSTMWHIQDQYQDIPMNLSERSVEQWRWVHLDQKNPFQRLENYTYENAFKALQTRPDYNQQIQQVYERRNIEGTVGYQLFHDRYQWWNITKIGSKWRSLKYECEMNQIIADVQSIAIKAQAAAERAPVINIEQAAPRTIAHCQVIDSKPVIVVQDYVCPAENHAQRVAAVQAPQVVVEKEYVLSDGATTILNEQHKDVTKYEQCSGTPIQQQAHAEFVEIVDQCADMRYAPDTSQEFQYKLTGAVVDCADAGVDLAHKGHVGKAFTLADFCNKALNCGQVVWDVSSKSGVAVLVGAAKGLKNVGHGFVNLGNLAVDASQAAVKAAQYTVHHPRNAAHTVLAVSQQFGRALQEVHTKVIGVEIQFPQKRVTLGKDRMMYITFDGSVVPGIRLSPESQAQLAGAVKNLTMRTARYVKNHPYDAIENVTAFAVDFVVSGVITNAGLKGAAQVYAVSKNVTQSAGVKAVRTFDNMRKEFAFKRVVTTPEGIKSSVKNTTTLLSEGAQDAGNKIAPKIAGKVAEKVEQKVINVAVETEHAVQAEQKVASVATAVAEEVPAYAKPGFSAYCMETFQKMQEVNNTLKSKFAELGLEAITKHDLKHIAKNHMSGGQFAVVGKKSVFNEGVDCVALAAEGWAKGIKEGTRTVVFDTGKIIGVTIDGRPTSKVEIWLNGNLKSIKTIYPCP